MQKIPLISLFACLWLVFSGCSQDLKHQITKLESEKKDCRAILDEKQVEIDRLVMEISRLSLGNDALQILLDKKQAEIERLAGATATAETESLKKQIDELRAQRDAIRSEKASIEGRLAGLRTVRIKVLTGDGDPASAARMAETVGGMGYRIEKVDLAPSAGFSRHTVFYAPDSRKDAENITSRLGGGAVARPLSWPSVFNIIVVTGKPH